MGRDRQSLILVDTHILLWINSGHWKKIGTQTLKYLNKRKILISPICLLETDYLNEIGRIQENSNSVLANLLTGNNIELNDISTYALTSQAAEIDWTRDIFDRLLVAHTKVLGIELVTHDRKILKHFDMARK